MSFTDEQLKILIREGQYSDTAAEAYLLKTLKERRDITGRYWYQRINPLGKFTISASVPKDPILSFTDMGIEGKLWDRKPTRYRYTFNINGTTINKLGYTTERTSLSMSQLENFAIEHKKIEKPISGLDQWEITLRVSRDYGVKWSKWVKVYMTRNPSSGEFRLLGLNREN